MFFKENPFLKRIKPTPPVAVINESKWENDVVYVRFVSDMEEKADVYLDDALIKEAFSPMEITGYMVAKHKSVIKIYDHQSGKLLLKDTLKKNHNGIHTIALSHQLHKVYFDVYDDRSQFTMPLYATLRVLCLGKDKTQRISISTEDTSGTHLLFLDVRAKESTIYRSLPSGKSTILCDWDASKEPLKLQENFLKKHAYTLFLFQNAENMKAKLVKDRDF